MRIARPQTRRPWTPSRNSTASGVASVQESRKRPTKYPPSPNEARDVNTSHKPPTIAKIAEVSRQVDDGEATAKPMPDPKERSTNETAAATNAPATIGLHCTYGGLGTGTVET